VAGPERDGCLDGTTTESVDVAAAAVADTNLDRDPMESDGNDCRDERSRSVVVVAVADDRAVAIGETSGDVAGGGSVDGSGVCVAEDTDPGTDLLPLPVVVVP